eukprot:scaffold2324_cov266-Pinguiococcus_pyrenoidosus.AAC.16
MLWVFASASLRILEEPIFGAASGVNGITGIASRGCGAMLPSSRAVEGCNLLSAELRVVFRSLLLGAGGARSRGEASSLSSVDSTLRVACGVFSADLGRNGGPGHHGWSFKSQSKPRLFWRIRREQPVDLGRSDVSLGSVAACTAIRRTARLGNFPHLVIRGPQQDPVRRREQQDPLFRLLPNWLDRHYWSLQLALVHEPAHDPILRLGNCVEPDPSIRVAGHKASLPSLAQGDDRRRGVVTQRQEHSRLGVPDKDTSRRASAHQEAIAQRLQRREAVIHQKPPIVRAHGNASLLFHVSRRFGRRAAPRAGSEKRCRVNRPVACFDAAHEGVHVVVGSRIRRVVGQDKAQAERASFVATDEDFAGG